MGYEDRIKRALSNSIYGSAARVIVSGIECDCESLASKINKDLKQAARRGELDGLTAIANVFVRELMDCSNEDQSPLLLLRERGQQITERLQRATTGDWHNDPQGLVPAFRTAVLAEVRRLGNNCGTEHLQSPVVWVTQRVKACLSQTITKALGPCACKSANKRGKTSVDARAQVSGIVGLCELDLVAGAIVARTQGQLPSIRTKRDKPAVRRNISLLSGSLQVRSVQPGQTSLPVSGNAAS
jgi:hypothetical protein